MLTPIKLSESVGKTVSGVAFSERAGQCVMVFDECFATLGVWKGYEEVVVADVPLRLTEFGDQELIKVGIATKHDLERIRQEEMEDWREQVRIMEMREYERLKQKFGEA